MSWDAGARTAQFTYRLSGPVAAIQSAVDDAREDLSRSIRHLLARLACGKEEV